MSNLPSPKMTKWPFLLADLFLVAFAVWITFQSAHPIGLWQVGFGLCALVAGGWFSTIPFRSDFQSEVRLSEAGTLASAVSQIQNLTEIQNHLNAANLEWREVHERSQASVQAAKEIAEGIKAEAKSFSEFISKTSSAEKNHLRLELEKMKRAEGEWLQMSVRILDHVYAVQQAAVRSGQPALMMQMQQFQNACREAARRVGLVPIVAAPGTPFDPQLHQTVKGAPPLEGNAGIGETLATGYSYQGQLVRKVLVAPPAAPVLAKAEEDSPNEAAAPEAASSAILCAEEAASAIAPVPVAGASEESEGASGKQPD